MTFQECLNRFHDTFHNAEVDDYRPVCYEMFQENKEGMTIWLKNGDMMVYYPKEAENEDY